MDAPTGIENYTVIRNNRTMRFGYTTGSCAAAAARGSVSMLLSQKPLESVDLMTPKGIPLHLSLVDIRITPDEASCAVKKDAGDDPDSTDGILVYVTARRREMAGIVLDGGTGVGRVTKPGLAVPPGGAAINPVPRAMILKEAEDCASEYGYEGGLSLTVSVPGGEEIARKTFNPRLGIVGGISILGTSGIVEPMSEHALVESIRIEMQQLHSEGYEYLAVVPGNYGEAFLRGSTKLGNVKCIHCSNYIGETLDMAVNMGIKGVLFVGHAGKLVKTAAGIMNTHSREADGRMEILSAAALTAGADNMLCRRILNCTTTDDAIGLIASAGFRESTMQILMEKIQFYLDHRSYDRILTGAVMFSNVHGLLGKTKTADELEKMILAQKTADQTEE